MKQSSLVQPLLGFFVFPAYIIGLIWACGVSENKESDASIAKESIESQVAVKDSSSLSNVKYVVNYSNY
ncbi:MAG: hypothetical protein K2P88_15545 [Chitinophagaceae bacterium]|uniref:hypothetical protein n=1 Tax=unclassified Paraflavitalea TaxID=2798305 RepID=UPI003D3409F3|nr:hypothetical protein [Chitinophagaceae bacterium]